jgi:hypothetical protein
MSADKGCHGVEQVGGSGIYFLFPVACKFFVFDQEFAQTLGVALRLTPDGISERGSK